MSKGMQLASERRSQEPGLGGPWAGRSRGPSATAHRVTAWLRSPVGNHPESLMPQALASTWDSCPGGLVVWMERIKSVPGSCPSFSTKRDLRRGFLFDAGQGPGSPAHPPWWVWGSVAPHPGLFAPPDSWHPDSPWPRAGARQAMGWRRVRTASVAGCPRDPLAHSSEVLLTPTAGPKPRGVGPGASRSPLCTQRLARSRCPGKVC